MKKLILAISSLLMIFGLSQLKVQADDFTVDAKSAIAIDANSGKILYSQNATDSSTQIASITKTMTAYMVYQAIQDKKMSLDTLVPISDYAYNLTLNSNASNIPLAQGESFKVSELLNALMLPSANSAAIALAEKVAGSEPKFIDLMTAQLKKWGINDAKLYSSSGLPNSELAGHIYPGSKESDANTMSALDVAIIQYHLLKDYPQILKITGLTELPFDTGGLSQSTLYNTNQLLGGQLARTGVDGLKTGSTGMKIDCFTGTTLQNGIRIITVILEAKNVDDQNATVFSQTNKLMNHVYQNWTNSTLVKKGQKMTDFTTMNVIDGKEKTVELVASRDFNAIVSTEDATTGKGLSVQFDRKTSATAQAPIKKGNQLVVATAKYSDKLGYIPGTKGQTLYLIASNAVEKSAAPVVWWNHFVKFVNEKL